jgi:TatD DNase family protein
MPEAPPRLVDTHAHLMDAQYRDDLDAVLERAAAAGVGTLMCVGYDRASSEQAVALAERHANIYATVGVHPNYAGQAAADDFDAIRVLATHPRVVGLGETGLDNYRQHTAPAVQLDWLRRHLDLAGERGLPVVIHCREANERVADELTRWAAGLGPRRRPPGVLHCFNGSWSLAERCMAVGFLVSFAGPLTFRRTGDLVDAARIVPTERIVVETDSPFLAPPPHRGRRNEPAWVRYTAERLAELRNVDVRDLATQTTRNAVRLFGLPDVVQASAEGA